MKRVERAIVTAYQKAFSAAPAREAGQAEWDAYNKTLSAVEEMLQASHGDVRHPTDGFDADMEGFSVVSDGTDGREVGEASRIHWIDYLLCVFFGSDGGLRATCPPRHPGTIILRDGPTGRCNLLQSMAGAGASVTDLEFFTNILSPSAFEVIDEITYLRMPKNSEWVPGIVLIPCEDGLEVGLHRATLADLELHWDI